MVNTLGLLLGGTVVLFAVVFHFARGSGWTPGQDITQDVIEHRAATVPDTDFPEPSIRTMGAGATAAGAVAGGEVGAEGELEGAEEAEEPSPADIPEDEIEEFDVDWVKEDAAVPVANNETLLEAGEDEGWDLPYACREGQCLSCSAHIPDGPADDFVVHDDQEMLSEGELDEGYVLTCVAYPRTEFSIETNEAP